jgi:Raf kinase inhibitor-like YbhB/YbcL family protein
MIRSRVGSLLIVASLAAATADCKKQAAAPPPQPPATSDAERTGDETMSLVIQSPAFAANETIPKRFAGDGGDVSPPLNFGGVPASAKELALICDDPDAPTPQPWVHWVIYKIPADVTGLPENVAKTKSPAAPAGVLQGMNSWDKIGYGGPAPPPGHGVHHYHFKLYALDTRLDAAAGLDKDGLLTAIDGHVVAEAELVGTYQR